MNKVYRIVWNPHTGECMAVSELARGKIKSAVRGATAALIMASASVSALDIQQYNPRDNDDLAGAYIVTGHETFSNNSAGQGWNALDPGKSGKVYDNIQKAMAENRIVTGSVGHGGIALLIPSKSYSVAYFDKQTQTNQTVRVYDSALITDTKIDDYAFYRGEPVGDDQYTNMRMATVKNGAVLNVDVGTHADDWQTHTENFFQANVKASHVFDVEDGGTLNYLSKTKVTINPAVAESFTDGIATKISFNETTYTGSFTDFSGAQRSVNSTADFITYNDALIAAIKSGALAPAQYDAELQKAYSNTPNVIGIAPNTPMTENDDLTVGSDASNNDFLHASGKNAVINLAADANLQEINSAITLVKVEDGATFNNNGQLGVRGPLGFSDAVRAIDAVVNNNGVIDVGTDRVLTDDFSILGSRRGIGAYGASEINNNAGAIINVGGIGTQTYQMKGIDAANKSVVNNAGIINVGTTASDLSAGPTLYSAGIELANSASLTQSGEIYIGRRPMGSPSDVVDEIAVQTPATGIVARNDSSVTTTADSHITLGSQAQGVTGISMIGSGVSLDQQGTIDINGANNTGGSMNNIGIYAQSGAGSASKALNNAGTINVNGINGIALMVDGGSQLSNNGIVNVNGGYDPTTKLANYGMYVSGAGSVGNDAGTENLYGDAAVALHARDGGTIIVSNEGTVNFANGRHQTGYFVYGQGSAIENNASGNQAVSTADSTLYRIDGGASFVGDASPLAAIASGENSAIVTVTGAGSQFSSGAMDMTVSGKNATGVRVEGGAAGEISDNGVTVSLSGDGATAGIVDGNYYDLAGNVVDSAKGDSVLTSYANLNTSNTADNAYGYIARNGGRLVNKGSINFDAANSTGVLLDGGILDNQNSIASNGIGVNIQGEDSVVNNSTEGSVTATNGTAAYYVGSGASLSLQGSGQTAAAGTAHGILLAEGAKGLNVSGATINMSSTGSGSAIENVANIEGISLEDTTINVGNGIGIHSGASLAQTNSGVINVSGSGTGILFENIDGSTTDNALDMSDSSGLVINVDSANGNGIVTNSSTDLKTGVSVNVNDASGGSALVVKGSTKHVAQSGNLVSQSTVSPVVDIDNGIVESFVNSGKILAASIANKAVETLTGAGVAFSNAANGIIEGQVNLMSGNNSVTLESGSQGDDFTTGSGDDLFTLKDIKADETSLFTTLNGGAGNDTLALDNSHYVLNDVAAITGMENIRLENGSNFTLNNVMLALGDAQDDAVNTGYAIDATSKLNLLAAQDVSFKNHLAGNGLVNVNTGGNNFAFTANNASDAFAGSVALEDSKFALAGLNTQALSDARLILGDKSTAVVGSGTQNIAGLAFNGGTAVFNTGTPGQTIADTLIHTKDSLDISGTGTVQVNPGTVDNSQPLAPAHISLMEQDDEQTLIKLADSDGVVTGSGGNLVLTDSTGKVISDGIVSDIAQDGNVVAKGTYDYRLTSGDNADGLYVNYGLTQVELQGLGADALVLDANGATGNAADLSAKVTGSGDLAINAGAGNTVTLSNSANDYTGVTTVNNGSLKMMNDNVLGKTSLLSLAIDSALDMNGHLQSVGKLATATGSALDLAGGSLTVEQGGEANGTLTGAGELHATAGTLTVNGSNETLSAHTIIDDGATVNINSASGLGNGDISVAGNLAIATAKGDLNNMLDGAGKVALTGSDIALAADNSAFSGQFAIDSGSELTATQAANLGTAKVEDLGKLVLDTDTDWTLANLVEGSGSVTKLGAGTLTVGDGAAWTGSTDIDNGTLLLGSKTVPVTLASSRVNISENGTLAGFGGVAGDVNNLGSLYVGNPQPAVSRLLKATTEPDELLIGGNLSNSGNMFVGNSSSKPGNQLVVAGNYAGNGGTLHLNTALSDDRSATDKLVVNGDTSGSTKVSVTNVGGEGALTTNGIEVIHVDGKSGGEFTQSGRIVAGAYDYTLLRGEGANIGNWYLSNTGKPVDPVNPDNPDDPTPTPVDPQVRPEYGSYIANLAAANTMFVQRLHDRLGETQYIDALTGEKKVTSMWMRNVGGHTNWRDSSGQLKTQSNRYVVQMGGDFAQWSSDGLDRTHLGMMAGYGNSKSDTTSSRTGNGSKGSVNGYSVGVYGTWYANDEEKSGTYIDSWAQYSWFNNSVSGGGLASEEYKSKGVTASLEAGQTFKMGTFSGQEGSLNSWFIQPKAQAIWMGVAADDHRDSSGTRVQSDGDGNIQTRLGVRTFLKGHHKMDADKQREFEPFVEVNWIHNTKDFSTSMNDINYSQKGTRNIGEAKVGVEGQINPQLNLWGNVGIQMGDKGYNDTAAMVGVKYNFQ